MSTHVGGGRVVVVGAGQAGFETVMSLRTNGYAGPITLVGTETGVPYQRPPLSKAYLHPGGSGPVPDEVCLRPQSWFERSDVVLRSGRTVTRIDRGERQVELDDGAHLPFDHLVLATGARNRRLAVPGADLPGVHYLRTLEEAHSLISALDSCGSVVVVGAGFIGLEIAAAAVKRGARVSVVEAADRPMARAVSEPISTFFAQAHRQHGTDLRFSAGVVSITEKNGRAAGVETTDGTVLSADVVVVGIGVVPDTAVAETADLAVDNGVVVDRHLRTADPAIFAIGDCASYPAPGGQRSLRLESVQNAVDHARCVAAQIAGGDEPYAAVPWFWTEQFDSKLQMAGLIDGHRRTVVRGSPGDGAFSVFCFGEDDELLGVESVNRTRDHMAARRLLAVSSQITPEQAADPAIDLKAISRS